ncbi:MAG: hypothetical protein Q9M33_04735 [Robiginitomaculum sp.]|nr:hypothetical protein [Robiginitomaculum sp.]MDQ7076571.1 hypothetical protein [Robiginitomaculum sp.]
MSRISSISTASRPKDRTTPVRPAPRAESTVLVPLPRPKRRAAHRVQTAQSAAYSAHVLAGMPRRGLKGDPAEQKRVFATYARVQHGVSPLGRRLKIVA